MRPASALQQLEHRVQHRGAARRRRAARRCASSQATKRDMCVPFCSAGRATSSFHIGDRRRRPRLRSAAAADSARLRRRRAGSRAGGRRARSACRGCGGASIRLVIGESSGSAEACQQIGARVRHGSARAYRRLTLRSSAGGAPKRALDRLLDARGVEPHCASSLAGSPWSMKRVGQAELQHRHLDAGVGQRLDAPRCRRRP